MSKIRILFVDDSSLDRTLACRLLETVGWLTEQAVNSAEALDKVARLPFDIVVTDIATPQVNGKSLVETLHAQYPSLPVLLLATHESENVAVTTLRSGAAGYVRKRQLTDDLVPTIRSLLELTRPIREHKQTLAAMRACHVEFSLKNDPHEVMVVARQVELWMDGLALFEPSVRLQVSVSLREALANALFHGNLELDSSLKEQPGAWEALCSARMNAEPYRSRRTQLVVHLDSSEARFSVTDEGPGFCAVDVSQIASAEALDRVHGRGLLLIRSFMDEITYNTQGNSVTLLKRAT